MDKSQDSKLFSVGFEVASFVTSCGLLQRSWDVITSRHAGITYNIGVGLSWKVYKQQNVTIIAFENTLPYSSNLQSDMVSYPDLRDRNLDHFKFLSTLKNPIFSLNKTAVSLFNDNYQELNQLKSKINSYPDLLIITGLALGGSIASLFTLSLLDSFDSTKKRPLCITIGSPLIGDQKLQETISHSSTWNSCFLHVVSYKDSLPRRFIKNHSYMPFGTFLLCSESNTYCTSFENPDSILALLKDSIHDKNQVFQSIDYGYIVKSLSDGAILKDCVAQIGGINHPDSLHASISLQLQALGWTSPHMQQHVIDVNNLEILEKKFIHLKQKKAMEKIDTTLQKIEYSALEPSTSTFSDENLRHRRHDVFISFRGADTRITFVDHLYGHLTRKGIFVFKDDTTLEKGESISPQLLEAINNSRVAIVVFSSHYADSRWCLDEMAAITRCFWDNKLTVFPVFYDVDPSEVRKQNGVYEDAFRSHSSKRDSYNKVDQWRTTMTTLGGLVGWDVRNKSESAEIEIIAQAVIKKLGHKFSEVRS